MRVDLSEKEYRIEPTDRAWMKPVIGGRAANSKRLLEELDFACDPLGSENMLIFGIGPLTGTVCPASAYYTVTARSPLTGILGDSAAGGHFAAEMKLTGFDQIIFTGALDTLSYLLITAEGLDFVECPDLALKSIIETTCTVRKEQRDPAIQVAAIGPAGENIILFSTIVSSGNRVNGRTGMGAVMGSKKVKAVAVKGSQPVEIADPPRFLSETRTLEQHIMAHPEYSKRHHMGTTMLMQDLNSIGILPTNHFQKGVCPYVEHISGETLARTYKVKNKSCFNCPVHCSRYIICHEHQGEGPEFETLCSFTSRIGNENLEFALKMSIALNQMGLDSISTGEVIGWIMECQEKGLLTPEDVDGLSVHWGDTHAISTLIEKIVNRVGIGDVLAEGAWKASERFSEKARDLVMQVKGLDVICGDPRGIKAYGLTYAISSRGADHLRAEPYFELTNRKKEALRRFGTEQAANRLAEEGKAALVTYSEKIALLCDALTMCKNIGLCMDVLHFDSAAALLTAATGISYTPQQVEIYMGECITRDHLINTRCGMTRDADTLPERFLHEPLVEGPTAGSTVDITKMVDEYYALHGW